MNKEQCKECGVYVTEKELAVCAQEFLGAYRTGARHGETYNVLLIQGEVACSLESLDVKACKMLDKLVS